jgi:hypothetical protein
LKKKAKTCNEFKKAFEEVSVRHQENSSVYGWKVSDDFLYVSCEILCSTQQKNMAE